MDVRVNDKCFIAQFIKLWNAYYYESMNKILIIITLFVVIGCADKKTRSIQLQEIHFDGEHSEISEKKPEYIFIPLETRSDNLVGHINKVEIYNDKIYLNDFSIGKTVQVYDIKGNYISQIGHRGDGPGEYVVPHDFYLDKEAQTIVVIDQMKNRALIYDLNTYQHISTKELPFYFVSHIQLADRSYAWFNLFGFKEARNEHYIQITDSVYQNNTYLLEAPFVSSMGIWTQKTFYKLQDKAFFYLPFSPVIYEVTSRNIQPAYKISVQSHHFPPADFMQTIVGDGSLDYYRDLLASDYIMAYNTLETDDFMVVVYLIKNKIEVGIYNKQDKKSYQYPDFTNNLLQGGMELPFAGTYQHYFISSISPASFSDRYVRQDELRSMAANMSEDDNPILCLIKFN